MRGWVSTAPPVVLRITGMSGWAAGKGIASAASAASLGTPESAGEPSGGGLAWSGEPLSADESARGAASVVAESTATDPSTGALRLSSASQAAVAKAVQRAKRESHCRALGMGGLRAALREQGTFQSASQRELQADL